MGECMLLLHSSGLWNPHTMKKRRRKVGRAASQEMQQQTSTHVGRRRLMPSKRLNGGELKMAWLGQAFHTEKKEKQLQELLQRFQQGEMNVDTDVSIDDMQIRGFRRFLLRLQGKLRGSHIDPEAGEDITFSQFWKLLEEKRVNFVEYSDYGEHIAVILPHYTEAAGSKGKQKKLRVRNGQIEEVPVLYKRHAVKKMPADAMSDVWKKLHPQLIDIKVHRTNTIPLQLFPQVRILTVWTMRFALAAVIYLFLEKALWHANRFRDPLARGWVEKQDLSAGDFLLGALGESRAKFVSAEEKTGVTFDDFAGQDYVKRELQEVVKLLKESKVNPSVFVPKGVLLHGPPGTGKTLLARAIAGEAGLPFFSASGAEFVEMFAGVAAARVKDLFARARSFAPSIIFIDEIDAIGAKRGGPDVGGGGVEREQGLIQMLTELDGFQTGLSSSRVLVIGATNRMDMLDPALLRKGRIDKIMPVGVPTENGRLAILKVHARNKNFKSEQEKEQLLEEVSKLTHDASGAELANILNEAVILATRNDEDCIEKAHLLEAIERQAGRFKTGQEDVLDVSGEARTRVAYREAAVAVLECYFPNPYSHFTKTHLKDMDNFPNMKYEQAPDQIYAKKQDYIDSIVRKCAPRIIEGLVFGRENLSWLSGMAYSEAGLLVDHLMYQTGLTALGKIYYRTTKDIFNHMEPKIQALRDEYMRYAIQKCTAVLCEYRSAVETIVDRLLEKDEIEAAEIWDIFRKAPRIPQADVHPIDEYGALIYEGRWGIHGVSLPGRITFRPGNVGNAMFGAPQPRDVQIISDRVWRMMDQVIYKAKEDFDREMQSEEGRKEIRNELILANLMDNRDLDDLGMTELIKDCEDIELM